MLLDVAICTNRATLCMQSNAVGQTVSSSVQDSAVHRHQKDVEILDSSVHILGQDRWFEKGVLEAISVQLE